jgi:energy-coupling factor transport system permease protein
MIRRAALGQYVPLDTPAHRLDPATKIGVVAAFTVGLFAAGSFRGLLALGLATLAVLAVSRVPAGMAFRGLRAVSLILTLTVLANALRWQPATVSLARIGPLAVDGEGLATGVFFAVRIVLLVVGTSLLTLTTSPVELAGGIERVLRPLAVVGVPVGDLAMTLTIALRFIPTTVEEADRIVTAQAARGARFDSGGPLVRARAYAPVLVPLFFNLFRRADDLATAMEARCYRGSSGRTRLCEAHMRASDWAVLLVGVPALLALGVLL